MRTLENWNGVLLIEPDVFKDDRGWFMESFSEPKMKALGIDVMFVQDNHSYSQPKGVLRGIHFQNEPKAQSKLVRCTSGSILDVAVDLRKGSPHYKEWRSFELSETNKRMLFVPKGFGHGFLTLEEDVEVMYKVDGLYSKEHERSIRFDDPEIGVEWGVQKPLRSAKDEKAPSLRESDCNFLY